MEYRKSNIGSGDCLGYTAVMPRIPGSGAEGGRYPQV